MSEQTLAVYTIGTFLPLPRHSLMEPPVRCRKERCWVAVASSMLCVGIAAGLMITIRGKLWVIQAGAGRVCCLTSSR